MKRILGLIGLVMVSRAPLAYGQLDPGDCGVQGLRCAPNGVACTASDGKAGICRQQTAGCQCEPLNVCHLDRTSHSYTAMTVPQNSIPSHLRHGDCMIDDGVGCTIDRCDPTLGCVHTTDNSRCNDGLFCTMETCTPTGCVAISTCPPSMNGCIRVNDRCDEFNDVCLNRPDDSLCADGNLCTNDVCNATTGACSNPPVQCDDGNFCNGFEVCDQATGGCVIDSILFCDDFSLCTADRCDPATGCVNTPVSCPDDGNACTSDVCVNPLVGCQHLPISCDDHNLCTDDTCDPSFGCLHTPKCPTNMCVTTTCDPDVGECVSQPVTCTDTDGTACTVGRCDPILGCQQVPDNSLCDDGNPCSTDRCSPPTIQGGVIIPGGCINITYSCDDNNVCTTDTCDGLGGCLNTPKCNDGNLCTNDSCNLFTGECTNTPVTCPDTDNTPCTTATCNPLTGSCGLEVPNSSLCDDHIACTIDRCDPRTIQGGIIIPGGCTSIPNDAYCQRTFCNSTGADNGKACSGPADCPTGFCVPVNCELNECLPGGGTPDGCVRESVSCDDGDRCTSDSCVNRIGQVDCVHITLDPCPCQGDCPFTFNCDGDTGTCCSTVICGGDIHCCPGLTCVFSVVGSFCFEN